MSSAPLSPASLLLTDWTASPTGLALLALTATPYAVSVVRARRSGAAWPWWRPALYGLVGLGSLAYAVCGPLAVHRTDVFWVACLQIGVLASVTPVGLALGDPVGLVRARVAAGPTGRSPRMLRLLEGRPARVLTFPAVSSLLAVGTLLLVMLTPWFELTTRSPGAAAVLYVVLLLTGLLFVLPLLTDDLLPGWATPPVRTFLAFVDGLLDAVPGIIVMTSSTLLAPGFPGFASGVSGLSPALDQKYGGGALLAVAESIGIPVIAAVFVEWVRSDEREAREIDEQLDAPRRPSPVPEGRHAPGDADPAAVGGNGPEPGDRSDRLWWEDDPRLAARFRQRD